MKQLLFVLALFALISADSSVRVGGGFRGQFVVIDELDPGFGVGGHLLVGKYPFFFYPNMDFWYAGHSYTYEVWHYDHWDLYNETDFQAYEIAFNMDMKFAFPINPVSPYMGFGFCPVVTVYDNGYHDNGYHDSYTNFGFNAFCGMGFKINRASSCFFELRGKVGNGYNVFKMSFGMTFYGN